MTRTAKAPHCRGCGTQVSDQNPTPDHCGDCPPWTCDQCGHSCSMSAPCPCWVSLEGMALADIKALLALGDLSVGGIGSSAPEDPSDAGEA